MNGINKTDENLVLDSFLAGDIREELNDACEDDTLTQAVKTVLENHEMELTEDDDAVIVRCAIAKYLWEKGKLTKRALAAAEQAVAAFDYDENDRDTALFHRDAVAALQLLQTPAPKVKKPRPKPYRCPWHAGDLFRYQCTEQLASYGISDCLFVVVDTYKSGRKVAPILRIILKFSDTPDKYFFFPGAEGAVYYKEKEQMLAQGILVPHVMKYWLQMYVHTEEMVPKDKLQFLGNIPTQAATPKDERRPDVFYSEIFWDQFEERIGNKLKLWLRPYQQRTGYQLQEFVMPPEIDTETAGDSGTRQRGRSNRETTGTGNCL